MKSILDKNNFMKIKLYHGTNTVFIDSIKENGLAGKNIIRDYNIIRLSEEILELVENELKDPQFSKSNTLFSFKKMVNQTKDTAYNFQHGDTYLTPSINKAIQYAKNNKQGSEIISYLKVYVDKLIEENCEYIYEIEKKYSNAFELMRKEGKPIVIEIEEKTINITNLKSESGDDPSHVIKMIQDYIEKDEHLFDMLSNRMNFRLMKKISFNNLKIIDV